MEPDVQQFRSRAGQEFEVHFVTFDQESYTLFTTLMSALA